MSAAASTFALGSGTSAVPPILPTLRASSDEPDADQIKRAMRELTMIHGVPLILALSTQTGEWSILSTATRIPVCKPDQDLMTVIIRAEDAV